MSLGIGRISATVVAATFLFATGAATAQMRITEYMYNGNGAGSIGEFVEFTNIGTTSINMTGWSFDDNSRVPGSQSLSAFGTVVPGQSVILTDNTAAAFRTAWGLAASVVVIGGNGNNLGRADEINLYDNTNALVDRLTYDDQTIAGSPRTNGTSAWLCGEWLGRNSPTHLIVSVVGDSQGSHNNTGTTPLEVGSPGFYASSSPPCLCGNGAVDAGVQEQCDGGTCCNHACQFVASGTQCRASAGVCDAAESCTGQGAACPADVVQPSGTPCRQSAGLCDVAESCDGANTNCPADAFDTGSECRASTGPCDPAEDCDGSGTNCPADVHITQCLDGDGCCPQGCNANTDDDCPAICGNQIVEPGEDCDGSLASNCPSGSCRADCTCEPVAVPTVSEWGLALLTGIGVLVGGVVFTRKQPSRGARQTENQ